MFGEHPFKDTKAGSALNNAPKCPVCKSGEFDARQTEFEVLRKCRKCGNEWSGGSVGAARPSVLEDVPPPGMPAPDDDLPTNDFTGAAFRPWE